MQCPSCGSENTQSFQMAYETGAQDNVSTSRTFGAGATPGKIGGGSAVTVSSGTSMTKLAKRTAPPPYKSVGKSVAVMLFGGAFAGLFSGTLLAAIVACVAGVTAVLRYQYNKQEFPSLYEKWKRSWVCHKCGATYEV